MVVEHHERQSERVQISVALDETVRSQLEQAAKRSVRSISGEAAYRIRESLKADEPRAA
jgi:TraY domain